MREEVVIKFLKLITELSVGKLAVLGLIVTLLYFLIYYENGDDLQALITAAEANLAQESTKKAETTKILQEESEMKANIVELARKLEVVKSKIPSNFKDNDLIVLINQSASLSGLNIEQLAKRTNNAGLGAQTGFETANTKLIEEIVFNVSLTGTFNRFLDFTDRIAKNERMVRLKNVTIEKLYPGKPLERKISVKALAVGYKQATTAEAEVSNENNNRNHR